MTNLIPGSTLDRVLVRGGRVLSADGSRENTDVSDAISEEFEHQLGVPAVVAATGAAASACSSTS
ncbi:hypothetical protein IU427_24625 [Nocardia beijingensis]|uniref:hypothetical protein n=1 Tax=Nocardia beijingensis TaxID=95162 RepID=UPI0018940AE8|nr:hypothetical protein [Nocardia beijingensis]MBF6468331.1 hypothetical protein [Nocardia beijingensis]